MNEFNVLFVCTGNICRSPMAEYLFRDRPRPGPRWTASSAGTSAGPGMAASPAAVAVLREMGIDLTPHRSRPITQELVDEATLVVVMTAAHGEQVRALFPRGAEKVFLMRSFDSASDGGDIEDPIGSSEAVYRCIRDEINAALTGLLAFLKTEEERAEAT